MKANNSTHFSTNQLKQIHVISDCGITLTIEVVNSTIVSDQFDVLQNLLFHREKIHLLGF